MPCDPGRNRTCGRLIRNQLLYPLSYGAIALYIYAFCLFFLRCKYKVFMVAQIRYSQWVTTPRH
jgi:hypothetical protein